MKTNHDFSFEHSVIAEGGGPLLITNSKDAYTWEGEIKNSLNNKDEYKVWSYGALGKKIEKKFPDFQYELFPLNYDELLAYLKKLKSHVLSVEPNATLTPPKPAIDQETMDRINAAMDLINKEREVEENDDLMLVFYLNQKPVFCCEVHKITDFVRGYTGLGEKDICMVDMKKSAKGIIWSIHGAGFIDCGISKSKEEAIFLKSWVNKKKDEQIIQQFVSEIPGNKLEPTLKLTTGEITAFWSPLQGSKIPKLKIKNNLISWPGLSHAGIEFKLNPGEYEFYEGDHETSKWSCHWLRMKLIRS